MAAVSTRNIVKKFGELAAVNGISLEVPNGEFMVLLGPSGCGKTTFLRIICGLEQQTSGDLLIGGDIVNEIPPRARGVAMMFQSYGLYPHFSVRHNIAFPLRTQRVPSFLVLAAFPFYWMVITSFKTNGDLYSVTHVPFWFNDPPTLEHFRYLFDKTLFTTWLLNSLIIGVCVTAITLITALPAAYSLARMAGSNGEALGIGIFLTYLVPPTLLFLPLSRVISELGLQNSMWSLVVVYPTFTIPFCTWLLMGFFKALPVEI